MRRPTLFCLLIFFIFLWLLPLFCFRFLPFVDLPQHLAIAHIVHNYQNPQTPLYSQFFTLKWFPRAHILHTLFLHFASFLMPLEIAGKLFISLIIILLPLSIYQFIKALGGNRWFSLFSFFFIYNYNLMWGFIAYCLGISVFFFTLSLLLKLDERQRDVLKLNLSIALLLVLAVLLHAYIYLLVLVSFLVIGLFNKLKGKEVISRLCVMLPSLIFFLFCAQPLWAEKRHLILKNISTSLPSFASIQTRCLKLPRYLFFGRLDKVIFWFIFAVFLSLFLLWLIRAIRDKRWSLDRKDKAVYSLTLIIILLYFCLPLNLIGLHNIVGPRIAIFIPLLLIGPLSKVRLNRLSPLIVITSIALVLLFANLVIGFYRFNLQARPLSSLLKKTKENKRLVQLYTYPQSSAFYFHSFVHFSCYYTIWRDGLCGFIFPQTYPYHILQLKEGVKLPWINVFNAWESIFPRGWEDFDYFLICGRPASKNEQWLKKSDRLRLIGYEGIWRLYEKTKF